jgi:hypothetical protein
MRKLAVIFLVLFSFNVHSQERLDSLKEKNPQKVRNLFKTNPLPILWGPIPYTSEFRFLVEIAVKPYQTTQFGISALRKSPFLTLFEDSVFTGSNDKYFVRGWRFQAAHRFYAHTRYFAPYGFYCSPSFSISNATVSTEGLKKIGYYLKATYWNASLLGGLQLIVFQKVSIDGFMGLGYQDRLWWEHDDRFSKHRLMDNKEVLGRTTRHLKFSIGFNLGIAF